MYEIKYRINIEDKGKVKRITRAVVVENAVSLNDAANAVAMRLAGIELEAKEEIKCQSARPEPETEIVSARLVNIKETHPADSGDWYEVKVRENLVADETPMKYMMLFKADSLDDCMDRVRSALRQGYDMTTVAVRETPIWEVIDAGKYNAMALGGDA